MKNALKNWKTAVAGILMLGFSGFKIYQNPALLLDPSTDSTIAAGIGLIAAKDAAATEPTVAGK